jgi:glutathione S-transferase
MKLYAYRTCPFSRRVRITLAEKRVEVERVELSPDADHPAALRGRLPMRRGVPILDVRHDLVLWDSVAIMRWLDQAHARPMMPPSRDEHARTEAWIAWAPGALYALQYPLIRDPRDARAEHGLIEACVLLEAFAPTEGWWVGSSFTLADASMAPGLVTMPTHVERSMGPRLRAYVDRLRVRPSVRAVCELGQAGLRASSPSLA